MKSVQHCNCLRALDMKIMHIQQVIIAKKIILLHGCLPNRLYKYVDMIYWFEFEIFYNFTNIILKFLLRKNIHYNKTIGSNKTNTATTPTVIAYWSPLRSFSLQSITETQDGASCVCMKREREAARGVIWCQAAGWREHTTCTKAFTWSVSKINFD